MNHCASFSLSRARNWSLIAQCGWLWLPRPLGAQYRKGDVSSEGSAEAGGDVHILLAALKACGKSKELETGKLVQADAIQSGQFSDLYVSNAVINMHAKCGSMVDAQAIFDGIRRRNVISWTALMLGYAENGKCEQALELFARMKEEDCAPDARTFVAAFVACAGLAAQEQQEHGRKKKNNDKLKKCLEKGMSIHNQVPNGCYDVFVGNSLVDMYAKCGCMCVAQGVFDRMPMHSIVSWTVLLLGYVENGQAETALELFSRIQVEEVCVPNSRLIVAALMACSDIAAKEEGTNIDGKVVKERSLQKGIAVHSQARTSGCEWDTFVANSLVDMYSRCGSVRDAKLVFDGMKGEQDVVSWTSLILGYAENGEAKLALELFEEMQRLVTPKAQTFVAALVACGNVVALQSAKKINAQICRLGLESNTIVGNCLVDCYGKCGSLADAEWLFTSMSSRDLVAWSALLSAFSCQGATKQVFDLFQDMRNEVPDQQPDKIAILALLTACSHAGLVDKGRHCFSTMASRYGINPDIQHYHSVIDMLGRANRLEEVIQLVQQMPFQPTAVTWTTVLAACQKWKNVALGRLAFEALVRIDAKEDVGYVLMGNIYGGAGMWKERSQVLASLTKLKNSKLDEEQTWWSDDTGLVHRFTAGELFSHSQAETRRERLDQFSATEDAAGGGAFLCGHSERLAIAWALANSPPKSTVRIAKNSLVCERCHVAASRISGAEERVIICRDADRLHVFRDGKCCCS